MFDQNVLREAEKEQDDLPENHVHQKQMQHHQGSGPEIQMDENLDQMPKMM